MRRQMKRSLQTKSHERRALLLMTHPVRSVPCQIQLLIEVNLGQYLHPLRARQEGRHVANCMCSTERDILTCLLFSAFRRISRLLRKIIPLTLSIIN